MMIREMERATIDVKKEIMRFMIDNNVKMTEVAEGTAINLDLMSDEVISKLIELTDEINSRLVEPKYRIWEPELDD
jgi:hypothetical protein